MKTKLEKLELAAKVAGITILRYDGNSAWVVNSNGRSIVWNPENDNGDSFALLVAMRSRTLTLRMGSGGVCIDIDHPRIQSDEWSPLRGDYDPQAALRMAIFKAAVEIGESL